MHKVICADIVFTITNSKSPSFLINRYKLGRMIDETLHLTPFEALFLTAKGRIKSENPHFSRMLVLMKTLLPEENDVILYSVYEHLKIKGYYVKRESDCLYFRKSPREEYLGPLRVMRESSHVSFSRLSDIAGSLIATVDDENDITFFRLESADPRGEVDYTIPENTDAEIISDRIATSSSELPDWLGHEFKGVKFLTDLEAKLLHPDSGNQGSNHLFEVYRDLIGRKLIVKTGFKYGTNFRAYTKTMDEHADFLVHFIPEDEEWYKISRAVRVAHGVHKIMIFAGKTEKGVTYLSVERIKDPFLSQK